MFGKLTAGRFEVQKVDLANVGPGSYDLPTTLDDHGVTIVNGERFQEGHVEDTPGPGFYAAAAAKVEAMRKGASLSSKENKPPPRALTPDKSRSTTALAQKRSPRASESQLQQLTVPHSNEARLKAELQKVKASAAAQLDEFQAEIQKAESQCKIFAREAESRRKALEAALHGSHQRVSALEEADASKQQKFEELSLQHAALEAEVAAAQEKASEAEKAFASAKLALEVELTEAKKNHSEAAKAWQEAKDILEAELRRDHAESEKS